MKTRGMSNLLPQGHGLSIVETFGMFFFLTGLGVRRYASVEWRQLDASSGRHRLHDTSACRRQTAQSEQNSIRKIFQEGFEREV